jgi:GT2 family glycosyltransferase
VTDEIKVAVKDPNAKPSIMIATPMYGGMCTGHYVSGLLAAVSKLRDMGVKVYWAQMMNESLITRARNDLANTFLERGHDYLMFIDADVGFTAEAVLTLFAADRDVACGIYPKKEVDWTKVKAAADAGKENLKDYGGAFVFNMVGNAHAETDEHGMIEVRHGGTGFMLIKREVFQKLQPTVPKYTNDMILIVDKNPVKKIIDEFFATSIDETTNRLLSEDYHFCKIARLAGFKVYAAPWANLTHSGTYNFSGTLPRG